MTWIVFAAMTAAALALIVLPLRRRVGPAADRSAYDVEVYRDQLEELERDLQRGLIEATESDAARAEIGRRLLAADAGARPDGEPPAGTGARRSWIAGGLAVAIPAIAAVTYLPLGAPDLPGRPAAERRAERSVDPATGAAAMIARLSEHLHREPGDAESWSRLGGLLMSARRYEEAAGALGRASELTPGSADLRGRHGEALTLAANGTVSPRARQAFESALATDAREPRARFYLGMAEYQAGRRRAALRRWRALQADTPADAPWRELLGDQIARLAAELGAAPVAGDDEAPGPTSEDVAAASRMSADDRQAMIRSMVARLAGRLAETPDDADGWMRLGRSYKVLGEAAKSRDAYAKAAALRPNDSTVQKAHAASVAAAAGAAPKASSNETPGPTSDDVAAASRMSADDRQAMIRSMVARLAGRLAETPDDADGWMRLGRSYGVLRQPSKARAAYARAASLRPNDIKVLNSYAASMVDAAGTSAARQPEFNGVIRRVLELDPRNRTALWYAGLSARLSGDKEATGRHWRKLLSQLDAGSREHAELKRQLDALAAGP